MLSGLQFHPVHGIHGAGTISFLNSEKKGEIDHEII